MLAALKGDRRGSSQGLDTGRRRLACAVVTPLGHQTGRKTLARPWKSAEDRLIRMCLKQAGDLFVVSGQLIMPQAEVLDHRQHQAGLGLCGDGICL